MTIKNKIKEKLTQHGLWPEEVDSVVLNTISEPENEAMKDRWNDDEQDYPPAIVVLAWISAKFHAIDFLEQTKPKHFALNILKSV